GRRLSRAVAQECAVAQTTVGRTERPAFFGHCRSARRRPADGVADDSASLRNGGRAARRKDDHGRRRRQCGTAASTSHHRRKGNYRGCRLHRPRLYKARADPCTSRQGGIMTTNGVRHFLDLIDIPKPILTGLIDKSRAMKSSRERNMNSPAPLSGKTLAMVFDKPSTRTRVSFDVAMRQLGGEAMLLTAQEMQLGR